MKVRRKLEAKLVYCLEWQIWTKIERATLKEYFIDDREGTRINS